MSRSAPESLQALWLGIDPALAAWVERPAGGPAVVRVREHADGRPLPVADLGLRKGGRLGVVVSDSQARHWMQSPPSGIASLAELKAAAAARCVQLFGGAAGDWAISGDWQPGRPFMCAALPSGLCASLEETARTGQYRLSVRTLLGTWLAQGAALLPDAGWFAVRSLRSLSAGHCSGGRLQHIRTVGADPGELPQQAQLRALEVIQAESLRSAVEPESPVAWLDLRLHEKPAGVHSRRVVPVAAPGSRPAGLDAAGDAGLCAWTGWALAGEPA